MYNGSDPETILEKIYDIFNSSLSRIDRATAEISVEQSGYVDRKQRLSGSHCMEILSIIY